VLARWAGWGAVPKVFDERDEQFVAERAELRRLLGTEEAWAQARRTTLNAHYTSASVVTTMWGAASALGVEGPVRVLEPGCGSGNFLGLAPEDAVLTGVELDATTATIAEHLYGARATIRTGAFEELRVEDGAFDLIIGNVPFAKVTPHDPRHNRGRHALHNYFLLKSLHLTRPGGIVMALTSRYTLDAHNPSARREMAGLADLVGAIRLPEGAFAKSSGTDVVVDLLVLRRRLPGAEPTGPSWEHAVTTSAKGTGDRPGGDVEVNEYLVAHPDRVLGDLVTNKAKHRGIAGFIVDGLIRDLPGLKEADVPVYARGVTPFGPLHRGPGELNYAVSCGGIVVNPGDIVVADTSGIAVVRKEVAEDTITRLRAHRARMEQYVSDVKAGKFSNDWVDRQLAADHCLVE